MNKLDAHQGVMEPLSKVYGELCEIDPLIQDDWPSYERDIQWDGMQMDPEPLALFNARVLADVPDKLSMADLSKTTESLPLMVLFAACYSVKPHWMQSRNIYCGPHYSWVKENIESRLEELEDFRRQKLVKLNAAGSEMRRVAVRLASLYLGKIDALSLQEDYIDWQEERNDEAFQRQHELRLESIRERYVKAHKDIDEEESSDSATEDDSSNLGDDRDSG